MGEHPSGSQALAGGAHHALRRAPTHGIVDTAVPRLWVDLNPQNSD